MKTHVSPARRVGMSLCAAMVCACGVASAQQGQWTVTNLHPLGAASSNGYAVSSDREVGLATYGPPATEVYHAMLWRGTSSTFVDLNPQDTISSVGYGVNGALQAGYTQHDGNSPYHAALWQGTMSSWTDLNPPMAVLSSVNGTCADTQVGDCLVPGMSFHACLWRGSAATWMDLNADGMIESSALGVGDGEQVGKALVAMIGDCAILWRGTADSWVNLNPAGVNSSTAFGVSGGEQVGSVQIVSEDHAALWHGSAESFVDLNPPLGELSGSYARGVYAGQQVGYVYVRQRPNGDAPPHAALWSGTAASWVDLHKLLPVEFRDSIARAIWSDDKVIRVVGYGYNTLNARNEALLWTYNFSPCVADFNADGFLDFTDFDAFVVAFEGGQMSSDINGDGFLDVSDFDAFVDTFKAGC